MNPLQRAYKILLLDASTMDETARNRNAPYIALGILLVTALVNALRTPDVLVQTTGTFLSAVVIIAVIHGIALLLGGKATLWGFLAVVGHAELLSVLGVVHEIVAYLSGLWLVVVYIHTLRQVHKLSTCRAVGAVVIVVAALLLVLVGLNGLSALA